VDRPSDIAQGRAITSGGGPDEARVLYGLVPDGVATVTIVYTPGGHPDCLTLSGAGAAMLPTGIHGGCHRQRCLRSVERGSSVLETLTPDGTWLLVEPYAAIASKTTLAPSDTCSTGPSTLICTPASPRPGSRIGAWRAGRRGPAARGRHRGGLHPLPPRDPNAVQPRARSAALNSHSTSRCRRRCLPRTWGERRRCPKIGMPVPNPGAGTQEKEGSFTAWTRRSGTSSSQTATPRRSGEAARARSCTIRS
jgi:hypothetical protein